MENNRTQLESNRGRDFAESDSEDIKAMKQRFTNLKNEFQNKLLAHRSKTKELEKTVDSLRVELASEKQHLVDAETNYTQELMNTRSNSDLVVLRMSLYSTNKINSASEEIANAYEKYDTLKKESEVKIMSLVNEKKSLESALQTLKAKIDSLDSEDSNKKFEEKLNALKAQFENEKTEFEKECAELI